MTTSKETRTETNSRIGLPVLRIVTISFLVLAVLSPLASAQTDSTGGGGGE